MPRRRESAGPSRVKRRMTYIDLDETGTSEPSTERSEPQGPMSNRVYRNVQLPEVQRRSGFDRPLAVTGAARRSAQNSMLSPLRIRFGQKFRLRRRSSYCDDRPYPGGTCSTRSPDSHLRPHHSMARILARVRGNPMGPGEHLDQPQAPDSHTCRCPVPCLHGLL